MASKQAIERFQFLCDEIAARIREYPAGWIHDDLVGKLVAASELIGVPSPVSLDHIRNGPEHKIRINVHQVDTSGTGEIRETGIIWATNITTGEIVTDDFQEWNSHAIFWLDRWKRHVSMSCSSPDMSDLTTKEKRIVDIVGESTLTGQEIADQVGCERNSWFRNTLSSLVKRGYLVKGKSGRGYRLP